MHSAAAAPTFPFDWLLLIDEGCCGIFSEKYVSKNLTRDGSGWRFVGKVSDIRWVIRPGTFPIDELPPPNNSLTLLFEQAMIKYIESFDDY
jgi:hypothetical protein